MTKLMNDHFYQSFYKMFFGFCVSSQSKGRHHAGTGAQVRQPKDTPVIILPLGGGNIFTGKPDYFYIFFFLLLGIVTFQVIK